MRKISLFLAVLLTLSLLLAGCGEAEESVVPAASEILAASENTSAASEAAPAAAIDGADTSAYYLRVVEEQSDALTPFVRQAIAQGIDADTLFDNYLHEMSIPDNSLCFQKTERHMSENGVLLRTAVLLHTAVDASSDAPLDELVSTNYDFLCETDEKAEERTYQIVGLAVNGSYVTAEFTVSINGQQIGTYQVDNSVLLLPLESELFPVNQPVEIELNVLSGNLPIPDYIYVGIHSDLLGG